MKTRKPRSLRHALESSLSSKELDLLPRSYDLIGDIAILDLPEELINKKNLIGGKLIETFKNINVVANKKSDVGKQYRTKEVEILAGDARTKTVHKEYGCRYMLDIRTAYFSPRLGTERMRVAAQVGEGERVLVMFAGVGPYAILIAKCAEPAEVVAVELNPDAVKYMKQNIKLNKVDVKVIEGDVNVEVPNLGEFDRIIMPLPKDAGDFLDVAIAALKKDGRMHYYDFAHTTVESDEKVKGICAGLGHKIQIIDSVECGSYSPCLSRTCIDFKIM